MPGAKRKRRPLTEWGREGEKEIKARFARWEESLDHLKLEVFMDIQGVEGRKAVKCKTLRSEKKLAIQV